MTLARLASTDSFAVVEAPDYWRVLSHYDLQARLEPHERLLKEEGLIALEEFRLGKHQPTLLRCIQLPRELKA